MAYSKKSGTRTASYLFDGKPPVKRIDVTAGWDSIAKADMVIRRLKHMGLYPEDLLYCPADSYRLENFGYEKEDPETEDDDDEPVILCATEAEIHDPCGDWNVGDDMLGLEALIVFDPNKLKQVGGEYRYVPCPGISARDAAVVIFRITSRDVSDATDTLTLSFDPGFDLSNIYCKDVDLSFTTATTDNFNRANGNLGGNWSYASTNLQISSNQVNDNDLTGSRNAAMWTNNLAADQYSQIDVASVTFDNSSYLELYLRSSINNAAPFGNGIAYQAQINFLGTSGSGYAYIQYVNGSSAPIITSGAVSINTGTYKFTAVGNTLTLYYNGTPILQTTDNRISGSGYTGFALLNDISNGIVADNWQTGSLSAAIAGYNTNRSTRGTAPVRRHRGGFSSARPPTSSRSIRRHQSRRTLRQARKSPSK